jgi:hypothetical protein
MNIINSLYCIFCVICALLLFLLFWTITLASAIIVLPFYILGWKEAVSYIIGTVLPLFKGIEQKNAWLLNEVKNDR